MPERSSILNDEAGSVLKVEFAFGGSDEEGWIPFELKFQRGDKTISSLQEEILKSDLQNLARNLQATAQNGDRTNWIPTEPSFLVWAYKHPGGSVDVTFMIDDGLVYGGGTTDTGLALVLNVSPETLIDFSTSLTG